MSIAEYFAGKNIFMSGGSGFLGKVLIEKLLRAFPNIGNIYILLREKKGKSVETRLENIKALPLFDKLRDECPSALDKIIPIKGDVCDINLGISDADRKLLIEKVNIVYHTAASVRFDDNLRDAIIINVRGTREMVNLALQLKNIALFVHISTTYCNTDKRIIEEKLYPAHADWRDSIKIAEECDEKVLNSLSLKYMDPLPNTYTFCKSLAEHVVEDLCKGKLQTVIARPSVVIPVYEDPLPGWNDNFNGPVGLLMAGGKGLLRTVLGNRSSVPDYMPVDFVIKAIIIISHHCGVNGNKQEVDVYNVSQDNINCLTMGEVVDMGKELVKQSPFIQILWNPRFSMTNCWYNYYIQVLLFHMLPAFFLDIGLRLAGKKPMIFNIQRKIYIANNVLLYFMENTWTFVNKKALKLLENLNEDDREKFGLLTYQLTDEQVFQYYKNGKIGCAKFLLKEEFDVEKGKKNLFRYWVLDMIVRTIFFTYMLWLFIVKIDILGVLYRCVENYIRNLP